jgi:hypothetical protein
LRGLASGLCGRCTQMRLAEIGSMGRLWRAQGVRGCATSVRLKVCQRLDPPRRASSKRTGLPRVIWRPAGPDRRSARGRAPGRAPAPRRATGARRAALLQRARALAKGAATTCGSGGVAHRGQRGPPQRVRGPTGFPGHIGGRGEAAERLRGSAATAHSGGPSRHQRAAAGLVCWVQGHHTPRGGGGGGPQGSSCTARPLCRPAPSSCLPELWQQGCTRSARGAAAGVLCLHLRSSHAGPGRVLHVKVHLAEAGRQDVKQAA